MEEQRRREIALLSRTLDEPPAKIEEAIRSLEAKGLIIARRQPNPYTPPPAV